MLVILPLLLPLVLSINESVDDLDDYEYEGEEMNQWSNLASEEGESEPFENAVDVLYDSLVVQGIDLYKAMGHFDDCVLEDNELECQYQLLEFDLSLVKSQVEFQEVVDKIKALADQGEPNSQYLMG